MIVLIIIGVAAAIGILIGLVAYSSKVSNEDLKEKKAAASGSGIELGKENSEILAKGRANLLALRQLIMKISNAEIKKKAAGVGMKIEKILNTLKENPEKIQSVRQFFNYYLPTLSKVLTTYERLEHNDVPGDEMTDKVSAYLDNVSTAMDKQYENLFTGDVLDLSVEMEAMTLAVKRDGLLTDSGTNFEGLNFETKEKVPELTL